MPRGLRFAFGVFPFARSARFASAAAATFAFAEFVQSSVCFHPRFQGGPPQTGQFSLGGFGSFLLGVIALL